ncbi:MAG: ABC transporter permease [bacterium]|nr:ABC transporter permease [bacterium]
MNAVFKREFRAYFTSPVGYVVLAVFLFFQGLYFSYMFSTGYSDITFVFSQLFSIVLFVMPILTMRLVSEDTKQKVDQALFTAPVGTLSIILGKFFAAFSVLAVATSITLIYQFLLSMYVKLNWYVYFSNVVGLLLFGAAIIAVGIFVSSLTESQVIAAIGSFAISMFILTLDTIAEMVNIGFITKVVEWFSFSGRYSTFVSGILDYSNIVFFVSFVAVFLFLTVRILDKRRWA